MLGLILSYILWESYTLTKLFLHLIFIGRLSNPHYRRIYQYRSYVLYFQWMLLFVLIMAMIGYNADYILWFAGVDLPDPMNDCTLAIYLVTDSILCISTTILFFRPICRRLNKVAKLHESVVQKYGIISALQLMAAVSFQMSFISGLYIAQNVKSTDYLHAYYDICDVIQMMDCLLLMICIYFGFARKEIGTSSCRICELFCIWYLCSCCRLHEYQRFFELNQLRQQRLKAQLLSSSCRNDTSEGILVVITNTTNSRNSTEEMKISSTPEEMYWDACPSFDP